MPLSNAFAPALPERPRSACCCLGVTILLTLIHASCGSDALSGGDGIALGGLQGSYDITDVIDDESRLWDVPTPTCLLRVSGSRVSANCDKEDGERDESVAVDFTVKEELIAGDVIYQYNSGPDECYLARETIYTITGSASKESGAMVEGIFAPIAGSWTGSLTLEISFEEKLQPGAPGYCISDFELYAVSFDVVVAGSTAQIDWSGNEEQGILEVVATENAISVNGEVVSK